MSSYQFELVLRQYIAASDGTNDLSPSEFKSSIFRSELPYFDEWELPNPCAAVAVFVLGASLGWDGSGSGDVILFNVSSAWSSKIFPDWQRI